MGRTVTNIECLIFIVFTHRFELRNIVIQAILTIIIRNDEDGDFKIDPEGMCRYVFVYCCLQF